MTWNYDPERFLLPGGTARRLFHSYAEPQPICDYHCHLSPDAILEDKPFENIGQVWLGGDHYKWRAMRLAGVDERLVTGNASDFEKFEAFAGVCERLCGAPVHHWAQMELHDYFGIDQPLNRASAKEIYDRAGRVMADGQYSPRKMILRSDVRLLCTTDDPAADLSAHKALAGTDFACQVLPTFRPDNALKLNDPGYIGWVEQLEKAVGHPVRDYDSLLAALKERLDVFAASGIRLSDQVLEYKGYRKGSRYAANTAMLRRLRGEAVSEEQLLTYYWQLLEDLCAMYRKEGFLMQLHIGAYRNVNAAMLRTAGRDSGFDMMWDAPLATELVTFMDDLNARGLLPRMVLYPLNAKDFEVCAAAAASFPEMGLSGKVQLGAAWWHNDHKEGITAQLTAIAQQGLLPYFLGMLTDSRSFLSYARHGYFRRILCDFIGTRLDSAEFIADEQTVADLIADICWRNVWNALHS